MIDHALAYAARGWHVFPCEPEGKRPLGRLVPHGVKQATDDLRQVIAWWEAEPAANIGVATGSPSDLVVIDLDGPDAETTYGRLLHAHGPPGDTYLPDGATVRTGGGWHLYLAAGGLTVRNSARRLGPGVDTRGDGGYVIAPPSIHPTGRRYVWRDPVPDTGPPRLTGPWARLLITPPAPPAGTPRHAIPGDQRGTPYALAALTSECDKVRHTPEGGRNHALNEAAFAAGTLIGAGELNPEHAINQLTQAAKTAGLPPREAERTIASGIRAGRRKPRQRAA